MSKIFPDFSEYLVGEKLEKEERDWARTKHYERYAVLVRDILDVIEKPKPRVLELGCGSGWMPRAINRPMYYLGIDKSKDLIDLCNSKNQGLQDINFVCEDLRLLGTLTDIDLCYSFAVLKHFGLHEWRNIFRSMIRFGEWGLFQLQVAP